MRLPIYQIDAFAEEPFEGNPAAVVPLREWLPDKTMQAIAEENNLAETAFFIPTSHGFHIRWFTPKVEVKLCGHATLAAAFVLFECMDHKEDSVRFDSSSGPLSVSQKDRLLTLNFPSQKAEATDITEIITKGLGKKPLELYRNEDYLAVFESEKEVSEIIPDNRYLEQLDLRGVIITAPSDEQDFVARFFAPKCGIPEDPVTGSAFTQLMPYWSEKLGKSSLRARQISSRGGKVFCEIKGDRVLISGYAVKYMEGTFEIMKQP